MSPLEKIVQFLKIGLGIFFGMIGLTLMLKIISLLEVIATK